MAVLTELTRALSSGAVEVIDLTAPLSSETPLLELPPEFGQTARFALEEISRYDDRGPAWYWNNFHTGEHTGTHFDAPIHWITGRDGGADVSQVPARRLIAPAAVLDRTADATAGEPSELFVLRREDFLAFLEREPKVAIKIMMLLCQRIRWQSERMEESVLQPLPVRLARRLCALASDFGSEVHISQEQLGVFVGAARESVNRQLQLWRKDGILDLQRGRILLQNMNKLTEVARNE